MNRNAAPVLIGLNVIAVVVVVMLLIQSLALAGDVEEARSELGSVREQLNAAPSDAPISEVSTQLSEMETQIRDWFIQYRSGGGGSVGPDDPNLPAGVTETEREILDRLDEVLDDIEALNRRIDALCEGVPIC